MLLRATEGAFTEKINWVEQLFYRTEAARGEASFDDCFQPGYFEVDVPRNETKEFAVSAAAYSESETARQMLTSIGGSLEAVKASFNRELTSQAGVLENFYGLHPEVPVNDWLNWVLLAAFLHSRKCSWR